MTIHIQPHYLTACSSVSVSEQFDRWSELFYCVFNLTANQKSCSCCIFDRALMDECPSLLTDLYTNTHLAPVSLLLFFGPTFFPVCFYLIDRVPWCPPPPTHHPPPSCLSAGVTSTLSLSYLVHSSLFFQIWVRVKSRWEGQITFQLEILISTVPPRTGDLTITRIIIDLEALFDLFLQ